MIFNQQSRASSMLKTSGVGMVCHALNIVVGFVYRTVFIAILSERYLGISGLFSDILGLISLAELGIGVSIAYRFYKPIADNDVDHVARLMRFYKHVYLCIGVVVAALGLSLLPFLNDFVRDAGEVPADVNLHVVYLLYLAQSVAGYFFVYRLTIWNADRKNHVTLFTTMSSDTGRYGVQLLVLWLTRSYVLTLASGIVFVVAANYLLSVWTTRCYPEVFARCGALPRAEKIGIFKDSWAMLLHRIGGAIVCSTDSLVLSKFVGLAAVGFYSNYALLTSSLSRLVNQVIGGFTSNYGNAYAKLGEEDLYEFFRKMQFLNLAISGFTSSCLFLLIGPFIHLWLGERMRLDGLTEAVLALLFFMQTSWITVGAHIMASGLFVRDKPRPIIESILNLVISIALVVLLADKYKTAGVFIGTIVSNGVTAFWRAPYLLFTLKFHRTTWLYWAQYARMSVLPFAFVILVRRFASSAPETWLAWLACAAATGTAYLVAFAAVYGWTDDGRDFTRTVANKLASFRNRPALEEAA
jgi:O-antigen/teichoic acid export membrane protein